MILVLLWFFQPLQFAQAQDELDVRINEVNSTVDELPPEPKPAPTPLTDDELAEWEVQNKIPMSRRKKLNPWPGAFFGIRASYLIGASMVPKLGLGSELNAREALDFRAPHLGLDAGYTPQYEKWGAGASLDISAGMPKLDYLQSAPLHWLVTVYVNYVPSRFTRWIFGWNAISQTQLQYYGGQTLRLQGFGFRTGVHLRSRTYGLKQFEWFIHAGWVQLTNISAGFAGNQADYDPKKFLGPNGMIYNAWAVTGIQYNFHAAPEALTMF